MRRLRTGRFESYAQPPYTDSVSFAFVSRLAEIRESIGGSDITLRDAPQTPAMLTARVSQMRAEVTAMNLALDEGRDPCTCGSWQVAWDSAHSRWVCSTCADNNDYELYQIGPETRAAMRGIVTDLCIYDEGWPATSLAGYSGYGDANARMAARIRAACGVPGTETRVWQDHFRLAEPS